MWRVPHCSRPNQTRLIPRSRTKNPSYIYFSHYIIPSSQTLGASFQNSRFSFPPSLRTMKIVAAYLLAILGGNTSPSAEDLKKILGSVGAEADDDRIELLLSEVKGKDITELIASGREKLASVPSGGGVAVAAAGGGAGGAAALAAEEAKKEEKVEEKEESDDDMGFSLFD